MEIYNKVAGFMALGICGALLVTSLDLTFLVTIGVSLWVTRKGLLALTSGG